MRVIHIEQRIWILDKDALDELYIVKVTINLYDIPRELIPIDDHRL